MALKLVESFPRWLALTVALGVMAFFVADERALIGFIAIALVAAARYLTKDEAHGVLPQWLLNIVVIAAAAWTALAAVEQPEKFVEALATLCAWVQVVKFYEKPTPRNQAQLLVLSVFIVIAALLTSNSLPVGLMVFLYVPIALWTILLFQIHAGLHGPRAPTQTPAAPSPPGAARRLRWVTAGAAAFMTVFGVAVYLVIPRGMASDFITDWSSPAVGATIGFRDEIVLGRSGELEDNASTVLDLTILDEFGRNIGSEDRAVLLRGAVLDEYDAATGVWRRAPFRANPNNRPITVGENFQRLGPRTTGPIYEQRVTMRSKSNDFLFAMYRPIEIRFDRETNVLMDVSDMVLTSQRRSGRVSYTVLSQDDYSAPSSADEPDRLPALFQEGRIRDLAVERLAAAGFERDPDAHHDPNDRFIANAFERWLRVNHEYSTTMTATEDGEDPIEMFLFRTQRGHCEYFASAMAAMCRAVGIDARVVVGYRASEFNDIAGHYVVRQSNAHSWVEVLVAPNKWETFDPSPPDGVALAGSAPSGLLGRIRQLYDAVDHAWVTWVVGFDESTRSRLFGVPQGNQYRFMDNLGRLLSIERGALLSRVIRSLAVGAITFSVVAGAGFALRALWRRLIRRRPRAGQPGAMSDEPDPEILAQIAFYKRCLVRLKRLGLAKPRWRPPLAHARAIESQSSPASEALRTLADLYYAARFGRRALSDDELARADHALSTLEALRRAELEPSS